MAEVSLRCSDGCYQGSMKAGLCAGRGLHAFLSLFHLFFSILVGLGLTSSHVYLPLAAKALHVHKLFKQYREEVKSEKSLTISPVSVKSNSFQHLILVYPINEKRFTLYIVGSTAIFSLLLKTYYVWDIFSHSSKSRFISFCTVWYGMDMPISC